MPIPAALRGYLAAHQLAAESSDGLVFGRSATRPFNPNTVNNRAARAWADADLRYISLHECRHTFASLMIAAGVNAKALASSMGHATVTITFDRYGHLMPGDELEAARLLDVYLQSRNPL